MESVLEEGLVSVYLSVDLLEIKDIIRIKLEDGIGLKLQVGVSHQWGIVNQFIDRKMEDGRQVQDGDTLSL